MLSVNIGNIAIITIENVDYCCIIHNINKSETIDLLKASVLNIVDIYKKYCRNFKSTQDSFFPFFV